MPASEFIVRGGLAFMDEDNKGTYNPDKNNFQPRVGFAYQLNDKTVLRGGYAIYTVPALFDISGIYQPGFSAPTQIVPTADVGLTIRANLANPFPDGVANPPGASLGPNTFLGRTIGRFNDSSITSAASRCAGHSACSVSCRVSGSSKAPTSLAGATTCPPTQHQRRATGVPVHEPGSGSGDNRLPDRECHQSVPRPDPGRDAQQPDDAAPELLRPFPQSSNVDVRRYDGSSAFDSAQFRLEKRFNAGFSFQTSYTWSDFKEQVTKLNDTDADYEERFNNTHLPHRLVLNGICELPFGRGRRWAGDIRLVHALIGNWSVSAIWNWQSGRPDLTMGNVYYDGDITQLKTKYTTDPTVPVFDTSGFYFHDAAVQTNGVDDPVKQRADQRIRLANNVRTQPSRWDGLRTPHYTNWDMSFVKGFDIGRVRAQVHFELYNAFNDVFYNNANLDPTSANFGLVTSQNNLPRNIQIGTKIIF